MGLQMKSDPLLSSLSFFEGFLLAVLRDPIQPSCYKQDGVVPVCCALFSAFDS